MTFIIGLTGGIGSGKSAATDYFKQLGVPVIDADVIAHYWLRQAKVIETIADHFGSYVITKSGDIDRGKLRDIIFSQPEEKKWLEQLLHPLIRNDIKAKTKLLKEPYCILAIPLLLENHLQSWVNRVLVMDVSEKNQRERTAQRDKTTEAAVRKIMSQQMPLQEKLARADDILDNNGSLEALKNQVDQLHLHYTKLAAQHLNSGR